MEKGLNKEVTFLILLSVKRKKNQTQQTILEDENNIIESEFPLENTSFVILKWLSTAFCDFIISKTQVVPT